jgi:hypothetical protein
MSRNCVQAIRIPQSAFRNSTTLKLIGIVLMSTVSCQSAPSSSGEVRKPAVAGQFYPADPAKLRGEIEQYLHGKNVRITPPLLLISPHAGYVFSGPVAGTGYATIDKSTKTVILLGPPHHKWVAGLSIAPVDAYETPLGKVPLNAEIVKELRKSPLISADRTADAPEHSIEVQIPFLQVMLSSFSIVPILVGDADPEKAADLLLPYAKPGTLIVASSDLSHYHASGEAKAIDRKTIDAVLAGKTGAELDACGEHPIRIVMSLAKRLGLSPVLLDARNSFETAPGFGSEDRVVGYASIAFVSKNAGTQPAASAAPAVTAEQKPAGDVPEDAQKFLLRLARESLVAAVKEQARPSPTNTPIFTRENSGCFVTLTKGGQLRGCIGYIEGIKPLFEAVIDNAKNAALEDPRFSPVTADELGDIKIEVSVLTKPAPLAYTDPKDLLSKLVPGQDGIILQKGFNQSTFLPQVWEQLPDKVEFLEHLSVKGGMSRDGWKTANVKRYHAIHFQEQ